MGAVEMIVATSACGVIYAVFAGQPLTIRGGTGPLLVFTGLLYGTCKQYELPFLPTYAWVGLWTALFVVALGLSGASRLIHRLTRLTDEIFAALISIIFVYQAVASVLHAFPTSHIPDDTALFGLVLALGTYTVARALSRFRKTPYLRPPTAKVWPTSGRRSRWSAWCSPGACCPPSRCRTSTPPRRWEDRGSSRSSMLPAGYAGRAPYRPPLWLFWYRSGSWMRWCSLADAPMRVAFSTGSWPSATTLACWQSNTTLARAGSSVTREAPRGSMAGGPGSTC